MDWLEVLNPEQREAAMASVGPVMIVAGPGTGKTGTLAARITYLVSNGIVNPRELLALTFTSKAAAEMRERVGALLNVPDAQLSYISTFHSLCHRLLASREGELAFVQDSERLALIRSLAKPTELSGISGRELALRLSRYKNTVAAALAVTLDDPLARLAEMYTTELAARNLRDFDDLLGAAYRSTLDGLPDAHRVRYILIDEFQDTSEIQYALAKLLQPEGNLFVIGDPLQSIYAFRGAGGAMFDRFAEDFSDCRPITLTTSYRSTRGIVALANAIFPAAPELVPSSHESGRVRLIQTLNEYSEADWIVGEIEGSIGGTDLLQATAEQPEGNSFRDYAILYRAHRTSQAIRRRLEESGIPYQVVGDGSPYDRPELRCLIDILHCLVREVPADLVALTADKPFRNLSTRKRNTLLKQWRGWSHTESVSNLMARITSQLGFGQSDTAVRRDIAQFTSVLSQFDPMPNSLAAATAHLDRLSQNDFYDPGVDAVTLLTIHAAKGLEFPHVFLCGVEEGLLPRSHSDERGETDEEQRLFYVGITRARDWLDMTYAKERSRQSVKPSRFIRTLKIPELTRVTDPAMAMLERKRDKRMWERRQGKLF